MKPGNYTSNRRVMRQIREQIHQAVKREVRRQLRLVAEIRGGEEQPADPAHADTLPAPAPSSPDSDA